MRTDAELLADDFGAFYERHVDTVTAYISRRTRRPEQTFDLVAGVADAARVKLGMAPISLDDEALERIEARGRIDVEASLARLPESQRIAIVRRVLRDEEYESIAEDVGCSESVIRQRVSRGLAALRRAL